MKYKSFIIIIIINFWYMVVLKIYLPKTGYSILDDSEFFSGESFTKSIKLFFYRA